MKRSAATMERWARFIALFSVLALAASNARADGAEQEPAGYRQAVDDGLREFGAQNFEEARSLFRRAHAIAPSARTHRALGLSEFELRNYIDSIEHLEAALTSDVKPLSETQRAETERVLSRANAFVDRLTLAVKPEHAQIALDGTQLEAPKRGPLVLAIGEHVLEVSASGFTSQKSTLKVKGGESRTLSLALVSTADKAASAPDQSAARPWYKSPWLWTGVGVLVAGAAAGTGYALTRDEKSAHTSGGTSNVHLTGP